MATFGGPYMKPTFVWARLWTGVNYPIDNKVIEKHFVKVPNVSCAKPIVVSWVSATNLLT